MLHETIPVVDVSDFHAGGERRRRLVDTVGRSLVDIGFFAVTNHDVAPQLLRDTYQQAQAFFRLPEAVKAAYIRPQAKGQRGFTAFGREHAKDSAYPDLKEFYQLGRTDVPEEHPVHLPYGPNIWPEAHVPDFRPVMEELYRRLDGLGAILLEACALYIDQPPSLFRDMTRASDTILRVIHYPPLPADAPAGSIRAAAHEDINLITLLAGATSEGLELLQRDGSWLPIRAAYEHIVVDAGDMLQNVTNGLYRSTTHRVINPGDSTRDRLSMPFFVHPRGEVSLCPLPECVARTGGEPRYPDITARDYLEQRLREIGLG